MVFQEHPKVWWLQRINSPMWLNAFVQEKHGKRQGTLRRRLKIAPYHSRHPLIKPEMDHVPTRLIISLFTVQYLAAKVTKHLLGGVKIGGAAY
ncbi:hypothetical protein [Granulosicoccus antarcticus]|uniref:hypothetical protein n=1 Tax=Granulosicoccus antarcticus TaxID=437505 RepID=UPI000B5AB167|nr:hypothetical protein [Granulosicoccus antarcticus]